VSNYRHTCGCLQFVNCKQRCIQICRQNEIVNKADEIEFHEFKYYVLISYVIDTITPSTLNLRFVNRIEDKFHEFKYYVLISYVIDTITPSTLTQAETEC